MTFRHYMPLRKAAEAKESHQSIHKQTQEFIAKGGEIKTIALGMTGQKGLSTKTFIAEHDANENAHKIDSMKKGCVQCGANNTH